MIKKMVSLRKNKATVRRAHSVGNYVSVLCGVVIGLFVLLVVVAWSTKHVINGGSRLPGFLGALVLSAADFPVKVKGVFEIIRESHFPAGKENPYKTVAYPSNANISLEGGLLVSKVKSDGKNQVSLINLSKQSERVVFVPKDIIGGTVYSDKVGGSERHRESSLSSGNRIWHPHVSPDLRLTYTIPGNDLISFDLTRNREAWRVYGAFHHSIEQDSEGNYWTCASVDPKIQINEDLGQRKHVISYQDNCVVKVSQAGKVLKTISITEILIKSELDHLLFGVSNPERNHDPIHLNQVAAILRDEGVFKKGQLLVSLRNLSTVLLMDPNTESIVWSKTGPWMNQHCALPLHDSTFSILDNHSFASGEYWLVPKWQTKIMLHNIVSGETKDLLSGFAPSPGLRIGIEGRALPYQNIGWIVEDSVFGTIFLFVENKLVFKWQNNYTPEKVGVVSWCRYLNDRMVLDLENIIAVQKD